jgi:hypothetical protein
MMPVAHIGIIGHPAAVRLMDSTSPPDAAGPMNIPGFWPKAATPVPIPAGSGNTAISGTDARLTGATGPTMIPPLS